MSCCHPKKPFIASRFRSLQRSRGGLTQNPFFARDLVRFQDVHNSDYSEKTGLKEATGRQKLLQQRGIGNFRRLGCWHGRFPETFLVEKQNCEPLCPKILSNFCCPVRHNFAKFTLDVFNIFLKLSRQNTIGNRSQLHTTFCVDRLNSPTILR